MAMEREKMPSPESECRAVLGIESRKLVELIEPSSSNKFGVTTPTVSILRTVASRPLRAYHERARGRGRPYSLAGKCGA
jgi:hypothetical protein